MRALAAACVLACAACTQSGNGGGAAASPTPAPTYPGAAQLASAQQHAAAGRLADASTELREALRLVEEASALRIENFVFADSLPVGYGVYKPRGSSSFKPAEPMILYFEPVGMSRQKQGDLWGADLDFDAVVLNSDGSGSQQQPSLLQLQVPSRQPNRELYGTMRLHFGAFPEGSYFIQVTAKDKVGGETATARLPFTIEK